MAIGPGIGKSEETAQFVLGLLGATKLPVVVDADALNLIAAAEEVQPGFIRRAAEGRVMVADSASGRDGAAVWMLDCRGAGGKA